jgi:hypothetical protein
MPNNMPASDKQKAAVRTVLMDAYDPSDLTAGQASLLLDVAGYINGVVEFLRKSRGGQSM